MTGLSETTIIRIESGLSWPGTDTLEKIAAALKIRTSDLIRDAEDSNPENTSVNARSAFSASQMVQ
jgi:transcriptional regulator with XRE-family HTH domain